MGVQGYLPTSPESRIYSNPTALGKRPLLKSLQNNGEPVVFQRSPCRSVALAVGGGLSLSAFTLNWLGRKSRRPQRSITRPANSTVASPARSTASKQFQALDASSCLSCLDKRQKSILDVHYLYATPILRPGSSERLPALRWQEEVAAVRDALEIDIDVDSGSSVERDGTPLSVSTSSCASSGTARMQVLVATVNTLSRLAANCSPSGPSWWHIAAHSEPGGTGRLILEEEDGAPQVVSMSALFECQTPPLGVSVLACDGEQAGRALLDAGASFAIVATGQLRDSTARMFASHFYRRLHCACRGLETSNFLPEGFASRVQLAFRAAKEALKISANAAIRADAPQLILLEKGSLPPVAPLGRSCNLWVPVAISPETRGSAQQGVVAGDVEDDPIPVPALPVSTSSRSLPEDCEDFLGRGSDLQRLLQQLGAPRGRRVIVLHGPCGIGKSAISAELCRFATAPGRRFAPVKGRHRLAYVSLQNSSMDSETGTEACAHLSIFAAAAGLASNGRACLLIDRAEKQFGWHARGLLQKAQSVGVLSGLNIPNKKPGEPLIEWAGILVKELPGVEVTVHYSLKHQRSSNSAEAFHEWCMDAARVGVRRVLLVTGPNGPRHDAVRVLQQLGRPVSGLRYGVAFNACLPSEAAREAERQRLVQKLRTGVVQDVWLNTGVDEDLLREGIQFVRETSTRLGVQVELFASAMLPSVAQLQQMRERPWNGVQFSEEFLSSLRGMAQATSKALDVFRDNGVEPIVESKVRTSTDLSKLSAILDNDTTTLHALIDEESPPASAEREKQEITKNKVPEGALGLRRPPKQVDVAELQRFPPVKRRWGKGRPDV